MDPNQNLPTSTPPLVPETPIMPEVPIIQQPQQYVAPVEFTQPVINTPSPTPIIQPEPVAQTFSPTTPVEQPLVVPQSPASSEVFGSAPQQISSSVANQPKKFNKKMFIIIAAVIVALVGIVIAVWLMFFNGIALKQYSNADYSIMVPASYNKEGSGSTVDFKKPNMKSGYESKVSIMTTDIPEGLKSEFVTEMDKQFTKEAFASGGSITSYQETSNVSVEKSTKNSIDIRTASGNILDNKIVAGKFKLTMFITEKKAYLVMVGANINEPSLSASANKIIDSFKAK